MAQFASLAAALIKGVDRGPSEPAATPPKTASPKPVQVKLRRGGGVNLAVRLPAEDQAPVLEELLTELVPHLEDATCARVVRSALKSLQRSQTT